MHVELMLMYTIHISLIYRMFWNCYIKCKWPFIRLHANFSLLITIILNWTNIFAWKEDPFLCISIQRSPSRPTHHTHILQYNFYMYNITQFAFYPTEAKKKCLLCVLYTQHMHSILYACILYGKTPSGVSEKKAKSRADERKQNV